MKETAQQYIQRIMGNLDGKDPLKIQKSTAKKLNKLIKPLSKKELKHRPAANKWSIADFQGSARAQSGTPEIGTRETLGKSRPALGAREGNRDPLSAAVCGARCESRSAD
jgi:hypothetical protein